MHAVAEKLRNASWLEGSYSGPNSRIDAAYPDGFFQIDIIHARPVYGKPEGTRPEPTFRGSRRDAVSKGHVFVFATGAVVTWGYDGSERQRIDELLQPYHSKQPWPHYFHKNTERWPLPGMSSITAVLGKHEGSTITRGDFFDYNYQYITSMDDTEAPWAGAVATWTTEDIVTWLRTNGLDDMAPTIEEHGLNGEHFIQLTPEDIQSMFDKVSDQKRFAEKHKPFQRPLKPFNDKGQLYVESLDTHQQTRNAAHNHDNIIAMSLAFAQSVQLHVISKEIDWHKEIYRGLATQTRKNGKANISSKHLTQLIANHELIFHRLESKVVQPPTADTPSFFWDKSDEIETLFEEIQEYLDYDGTIDDVRYRWNTVKDNIHHLRSYTDDSRGLHLERLIVLFFLIEIIAIDWEDVFAMWRKRGDRLVRYIHREEDDVERMVEKLM